MSKHHGEKHIYVDKSAEEKHIYVTDAEVEAACENFWAERMITPWRVLVEANKCSRLFAVRRAEMRDALEAARKVREGK